MSSLYLAGRTTTLGLGIAAVVLPSWHPLRLAEDLAVLDHLSGGRLEVGVARGITDRELSNLNAVRVERRFREASQRMFEETLAIVRHAWSTDAFTWDGEYYQFPRRGVHDSYAGWFPRNPAWRGDDGSYVGMSVVPKPKQNPIPLWNVGDSDTTIRFAAQHGMNLLTWLRSDAALPLTIEAYAQQLGDAGNDASHAVDRFALMRVCFVAETDERARQIAEPAVESLFRDYLGGLRGRSIYANPGERFGPEIEDVPWFDFLNERGHLLVGSPETVLARVQGYREQLGLRRMLAYTWLPGLDTEQILSSIELFGREVLPHLQEGEQHDAAGSEEVAHA